MKFDFLELFLLVVLISVVYGSEPCIDCGHFNRENPQPNKCVKDPEKCGKCKLGFSETDLDNGCKAVKPQIIKSPKTGIIVESGANVTLLCIFNTEVNCFWMRKGYDLEIGGRYRYVDGHNGYNAKDCSLQITDFKDLDYGNWQCGSMSDANKEGVVSEETWLKRYRRIITSPTNITTQIGENVTLNCTFNTVVDCAWLRRSHNLEIAGRYKYVDATKNGSNTTDCSLRFNFQTIDDGKWQCSSMSDSTRGGIISDEIWITERKGDVCVSCENFNRRTLINHPCPNHSRHCGDCNNGFQENSKSECVPVNDPIPQCVAPPNADLDVVIGSSATLICAFNTLVDCIWWKDGAETEIENRYRYLSRFDGASEEYSRNCSIQIVPVEVTDLGQWSCGCKADSRIDGVECKPITLGVTNIAEKGQAQTIANVTITRTSVIAICIVFCSVVLVAVVIAVAVKFWKKNQTYEVAKTMEENADFENMNYQPTIYGAEA